MKKYRNCMEPGENLDWCRPYVDKTESYYAVLMQKIIYLKTPDGEISDPTPEQLEQFARTVNPDYDSYDGWDDTYIILDAMREIGCTDCPCCSYCDAMDEPYGDNEGE